MTLLESVREELTVWTSPDASQSALKQSYLAHLEAFGAGGLFRDSMGEHLTASCVAFDETLSHVLLTHHRKGGFWVQFGGHLEPADSSLAGAAERELREESGLSTATLAWSTPLELHRHGLGDVFGTCRAHLDVVFAARLSRSERPLASPESLDVAWFPVAEPPSGVVPDLPARLLQLRSAVEQLT